METYMKVGEQAYNAIGKAVVGHIKSNDAHEVKFTRVPDKEVYETYVARARNHVEIKNATLVDAGSLTELPSLLESELCRANPRPAEIQVIQPNWARDIWAVFFKERL